MTENFYPTITNDGSIGLYNTEVDDIYHSTKGAYTEALEKFVYPSGIIEFAKTNNTIRILDICYGLGYNSKAAINEILKVNPMCNIKIDCLEVDEKVLALSTLINQPNIDKNIQKILNSELLKSSKVKKAAAEFFSAISYKDFIDLKLRSFYRLKTNRRVKYFKQHKYLSSIHNIYYKSDLNRYISSIRSIYINNQILPEFYICDARRAIKQLTGQYDFIFHDGFTPIKLPTLWSVEFFSELYRLLDDNGRLITYSSAAAVRNGLIISGFSLGCNKVGRKSIGTIASKNKQLITNQLSQLEHGLLNTKAGLPFRDPLLSLEPEIIIENRNIEIENSMLMGSGKYLKTNHCK